MTVLPCTNHRRMVNGYELNITARLVGINEAPYMAALIVHTTRVYVYLTKLIEAKAVQVPAEHNISAEIAIGRNPEIVGKEAYIFEPFPETRVTIFCWNHKVDLTLHSSDEPQQALDLYWANEAAKKELDALYPVESHNAPQTALQATNTRESAPQAMNTHEGAENGVMRVNGKKAAKELPARSQFIMPIAQIGAVMSRDGKLTWELYGFYGGKPGQYADLVVYSDNEIAIKTHLTDALAEICEQAGAVKTGNWIVSGSVGEKNGKKSLYVNAIAETEELLQAHNADDVTGNV